MLNVKTETHDGVCIIGLEGRLEAFTVAALSETVESLDPAHNVVVDLRDVTFLDSAGLAVLVKLLKEARRAQRDVALVRSQQEGTNRVLTLTRLDRVFHIADTVEAATAAFTDGAL